MLSSGEDLKIFHPLIFTISLFSLLTFIWTYLNPLQPRMHYAKLVWNWPSYSCLYFCLWTNLNTLHPRMLCANFSWNWLGGSGEDVFLSMYFLYFILSPFGKGCGPSFEQTYITFTWGCFVPSLVEIGSVVREKKILKIPSMYFS